MFVQTHFVYTLFRTFSKEFRLDTAAQKPNWMSGNGEIDCLFQGKSLRHQQYQLTQENQTVPFSYHLQNLLKTDPMLTNGSRAVQAQLVETHST